MAAKSGTIREDGMTETVRSFERGLRVIRGFGPTTPEMTLAEVARATDLNRATARRLLLTLEQLGYVRKRGDHFALTAKVLELGYSYLASLPAAQLAVPHLEELSATLRESSSMAVLDGADIVYVARVPANRVMTVSIGLGTRFPAYRTSMGRVLLAELPREEVESIWHASEHAAPTARTVTALAELEERLAEVRSQGWAMVDQELEMGVRSIAAPVRNASGEAIAAINVSTHVSRTSKAELCSRFVPALTDTATALSRALERHPGVGCRH